jgi:hypothetical protein
MKALLRYLPVLSFAGVILFAIAEILVRWLGGPVPIAREVPCHENNGKILCDLHFSQASAWTPSLIIQLMVTLVFSAAALYTVLSKNYRPTDRHWAYGALGTILGYWLGGTGHG